MILINSKTASSCLSLLCVLSSLVGCGSEITPSPQPVVAVPIEELSSSTDQTTVPITGAFGVELGGAFDHGNRPETQGRYAFEPKDAYELLTTYTVSVSPRSRRISSIMATGKLSSTYECSLERTILAGLLEDKYRAQDQTDRASRRERSLIDGDRSISVRCDRPPRGKELSLLSLKYTDSALQQEAAEELERPELDRSTRGL